MITFSRQLAGNAQAKASASAGHDHITHEEPSLSRGTAIQVSSEPDGYRNLILSQSVAAGLQDLLLEQDLFLEFDGRNRRIAGIWLSRGRQENGFHGATSCPNCPEAI